MDRAGLAPCVCGLSMLCAILVLQHRVDALVLAYRIRLAEAFLEAVRGQSLVADKHGRAILRWSSSDEERAGGRASKVRDIASFYWGEVRPAKVGGCWLIASTAFDLFINLRAPGSVPERTTPDGEHHDDEPGWVLEHKWKAHAIAMRDTLDDLIPESLDLVCRLGKVFEARLRRLDVCADVEGWEVDKKDRESVSKQPHAVIRQYEPGDGEDEDGSWN